MKKNLVLVISFLFISALAQDPQSKKTDYYMMKNNHVLHFLSTGEVETVMTNATLSGGTVLNSKGEVTMKGGSRKKINNGECIDAEGMVQPCNYLDSLLSAKIQSKEK